MTQLTLDSAILETVLKRAMSAARLVGYIENGVGDGLEAGLLADEIDAIIHELSELLGNPCLIAAPVPSSRSTFASDVVTRGDVVMRNGVPELVAPDMPAASGTHTFSLGIPSPCAALAPECGASCASRAHMLPLVSDANPRDKLALVPDPVELVIAFTDDESTLPHVRRLRPAHGRQRQHGGKAPATIGTESVPANDWQARAQRALAIVDARPAVWWMRAATVAALIGLVGLVLWLFGACGGAR